MAELLLYRQKSYLKKIDKLGSGIFKKVNLTRSAIYLDVGLASC
jgi:hypothetical protein